ncbi:hypothetical protein ACLOJK_027218, partial [Asimina triloba]
SCDLFAITAPCPIWVTCHEWVSLPMEKEELPDTGAMANQCFEAAVHLLGYLNIVARLVHRKLIWGISAMERRWVTVAAQFAATVQSTGLGKMNLRRIGLGFAGKDSCQAGLGMEAAGFGGKEHC